MAVVFVLKKLITAFLLPQGFAVLLFVILAGVFKRCRVWFFVLAVLAYGLSIEPTANLIMVPLEDAFPAASIAKIKTCDAYVVLGAGVREDVPDLNGHAALSIYAMPRVVAAYRLYRINPKPIILSGGKVFNREAEADVAAAFLVSLGVPQKHIIREPESRDTHENALYVKRIADARKLKKLVLITSAYHMKRSVLLFRRQFADLAVYPSDYQTSRRGYDLLSFVPDAGQAATINLAVKEYLGTCYYSMFPSH